MASPLLDNRSAYTVVTLDSGLRFVHVHRDTVAEIFGMATRVGSRDEPAGQYGLAHFVEHTIFKGTHKRRASSIINCMETVGGELNAYTTKEETFVYSIFPRGNASRATSLIADLVKDSAFPDAELDKEREVVADEIDSYLDTPSEAVFDDFDDLVFAASPLGHNILGDRESLMTFNSAVCRAFLDRFYRIPNMTVFYLGGESVATMTRLIDRHFSGLRDGAVVRRESRPPLIERFDETRGDGSNHQGHTVTGARIPSLFSPERHAFALLNNMLGGPGMNSRLNVALRERRGLVYSVESSLAMYTDCGLMAIYFGCNPEDTSRCRRLVETELRRMADNHLSPVALQRAKRQYIGQLTVSTASSEQTILSAARSLLLRDKVITPSEIAASIEALTPADLHAAATTLTPANFSTLTLT
ncbi:MAG: insulinase family protein [Muribaculaceae bacterium]|nr:insulinase family protein [Muribaculaceae bacterium]